jgi:transposase-like protein
MECLEADLEECTTPWDPEVHHRRIRTTNRLERLNGEGRRRTKVIPRFPTECSCLTLLYASLIALSKQWRGLAMTLSGSCKRCGPRVRRSRDGAWGIPNAFELLQAN